MKDAVARTLAYHERTKHHLGRYARAPGYLDWTTQPDPFRTFDFTLGGPVDDPRISTLPPYAHLELRDPGA